MLSSEVFTDLLSADTNGVVTLILTREEFISNSGLVTRIASKEAGQEVAPSLRVVCDEFLDRDSDGLPDRWERLNYLNPADPTDALLDLDGDRLTNLVEYDLGTSIYLMDSDGDGADDGFEHAAGFDPLNMLSVARVQKGVETIRQPSSDRQQWHQVLFEQVFAEPRQSSWGCHPSMAVILWWLSFAISQPPNLSFSSMSGTIVTRSTLLKPSAGWLYPQAITH